MKGVDVPGGSQDEQVLIVALYYPSQKYKIRQVV